MLNNFIYCSFLIFGISTLPNTSPLNINNTEKFFVRSSNISISNENVNHFPKPPQNVQIEYITSKNITLKWTIDQESLKFLKGFGLTVTCKFGICPDPENQTFIIEPVSNRDKDFDLDLNVNYGSNEIALYSLPYKDGCQSTIRKTIVTVIGDADETSLNWTFPFFIFTQQNQNLEINFQAAPKIYHINKYKICLMNENNSSRCSTSTNPPLIFKDISNGIYNIKGIVFDGSSNDEDENNCTNCSVVETSYTIQQEICEDNTNVKYIYPLLVGIFIAIFTILILALLYRISRLKRHNFKRKLILLLHTIDNEYHEKTINNFIKCLEYFNIIVHRPNFMNSQEELPWLISTFDNVLLLDSLALGKRQEAWAVDQDYKQFLVEPNSKELTKALFFVINMSQDLSKKEYFLRCKWNFVLEDSEFKNYPTNQPSFVIPDDFKSLIEKIQGCSVDMNICKTQISILKDSILEEAKFIKKNPNWFLEKYGTSMKIDNEVEVLDQHTPHPVLHDWISQVSSLLQKINQTTDYNLGLNQISDSYYEAISV